MENKRFHTGDLVGADIGSYGEIYGIIINDDVFHDSVNQDYYVMNTITFKDTEILNWSYYGAV